MKKKEFQAYLTVEISLLFPVILALLVCVIYLTFFSYNRTIAFQNAAICAMYGKYMDNDKSGKIERMYTILELLNKDQYIAANSLKQKVSIGGNVIAVNQKGNVNMPLLTPTIMSGFDYSEGIEVSCRQSVFYIRQVRKVNSNEE